MGNSIAVQAYTDGWRAAVERCAKIARKYSNAKPGEICEVMAGDWQEGIAKKIEAIAKERI